VRGTDVLLELGHLLRDVGERLLDGAEGMDVHLAAHLEEFVEFAQPVAGHHLPHTRPIAHDRDLERWARRTRAGVRVK
jgi:hypothetical protein